MMHESQHQSVTWNIIISHVLKCEMGQFHPRIHIFQSEMRFAEFMMIDNVIPSMELSSATFLTMTDDYFFSHFWAMLK